MNEHSLRIVRATANAYAQVLQERAGQTGVGSMPQASSVPAI